MIATIRRIHYFMNTARCPALLFAKKLVQTAATRILWLPLKGEAVAAAADEESVKRSPTPRRSDPHQTHLHQYWGQVMTKPCVGLLPAALERSETLITASPSQDRP